MERFKCYCSVQRCSRVISGLETGLVLFVLFIFRECALFQLLLLISKKLFLRCLLLNFFFCVCEASYRVHCTGRVRVINLAHYFNSICSFFYCRKCGRIYVHLINRYCSDSSKLFSFVHGATTANKDPRFHNYEILTD